MKSNLVVLFKVVVLF